MKFLGYIFRNARRNPLRSLLTIGSLAVCGFLTVVLFAYVQLNGEAAKASRPGNRLVSMSSAGFSGEVPISMVKDIIRIDEKSGENAILKFQFDEKTGRPRYAPEGEPAITEMAWVGNKFKDDPIPFTQFAVNPETFFAVFDEYRVPPKELEAFRKQRDGAIIGRKLAQDKNLKVGDPLPLKRNFYPIDLDLTVVGIYDGAANQDLRWCVYHWDMLNESIKAASEGRFADNASSVWMKCKNSASMPQLAKAIDDANRSSNTPTKTQSHEAFVAMFAEMWGGLQDYINGVGVAVLGALILICFVSLSMSVRERTGELAVLRAIGFRKHHLLFIVLMESVIVAGVGGLLGTFGTKLLFDVFDIAPYTMGALPYFNIPLMTAVWGMVGAVAIGLVSGFLPGLLAARISVVDGLRKVV